MHSMTGNVSGVGPTGWSLDVNILTFDKTPNFHF